MKLLNIMHNSKKINFKMLVVFSMWNIPELALMEELNVNERQLENLRGFQLKSMPFFN